jgi:hypothetical protein
VKLVAQSWKRGKSRDEPASDIGVVVLGYEEEPKASNTGVATVVSTDVDVVVSVAVVVVVSVAVVVVVIVPVIVCVTVPDTLTVLVRVAVLVAVLVTVLVTGGSVCVTVENCVEVEVDAVMPAAAA